MWEETINMWNIIDYNLIRDKRKTNKYLFYFYKMEF